MSLNRVNDIKKLNPVQAEKTGVYVAGTGIHMESRFFKAGDLITRNYKFSHKRGEKVAPKAEKKA